MPFLCWGIWRRVALELWSLGAMERWSNLLQIVTNRKSRWVVISHFIIGHWK